MFSPILKTSGSLPKACERHQQQVFLFSPSHSKKKHLESLCMPSMNGAVSQLFSRRQKSRPRISLPALSRIPSVSLRFRATCSQKRSTRRRRSLSTGASIDRPSAGQNHWRPRRHTNCTAGVGSPRLYLRYGVCSRCSENIRGRSCFSLYLSSRV